MLKKWTITKIGKATTNIKYSGLLKVTTGILAPSV